MLGLHFCARAFSSCGKRGPLFNTVLWLMGLVAPRHVDLSRPGLEPMSPALAGRFPTTAPPGKPYYLAFVEEKSLVSHSEIRTDWIQLLSDLQRKKKFVSSKQWVCGLCVSSLIWEDGILQAGLFLLTNKWRTYLQFWAHRNPWAQSGLPSPSLPPTIKGHPIACSCWNANIFRSKWKPLCLITYLINPARKWVPGPG